MPVEFHNLVDPPFATGRLEWRPIRVVGGATNSVVSGNAQLGLTSKKVVVKLLTDRGFSVESVCAWLATELGLPTPEPMWITVEPRRLVQIGAKWPYPDERPRRCFATEEMQLATSLRAAMLSQEHLADFVKLSDVMLAKIAAFDVLVGNDDRHDGNMLWVPPQGIYLIDHEKSMGGENMQFFSTSPQPGMNFMLQRLRELPSSRRSQLRGAVHSFCSDCMAIAQRAPLDKLAASGELASGIEQYLSESCDRLLDTMLEALGLPELFVTAPRATAVPLL